MRMLAKYDILLLMVLVCLLSGAEHATGGSLEYCTDVESIKRDASWCSGYVNVAIRNECRMRATIEICIQTRMTGRSCGAQDVQPGARMTYYTCDHLGYITYRSYPANQSSLENMDVQWTRIE
jgi:hypothetical protein